MTETTVPDAIHLEHIAKRFGAVTALQDVSLRLKRGEVLGLVGDNGAGKSTLIKIITGFIQPDTGKISVNGQEVKMRSVTHARSLGIETVYQDLALADNLDVVANLYLGREDLRPRIPWLGGVLDETTMEQRTWDVLRQLDFS